MLPRHPTPLLALIMITAACGDPYGFDPNGERPSQWIPEAVLHRFHKQRTGENFPAEPTVEDIETLWSGIDHDFLATVERLDLQWFRPVPHYEEKCLFWIALLPNLRQLELDLVDRSERDGVQSGPMTFVNPPSQVRLSDRIEVPSLEELYIVTNASQSLAALDGAPALRRLHLVSSAPIRMELLASCPNLRELVLERYLGPHRVSLIELDAPNDPGHEFRGLEQLSHLASITVVEHLELDGSSPARSDLADKLRAALPAHIKIEFVARKPSYRTD